MWAACELVIRAVAFIEGRYCRWPNAAERVALRQAAFNNPNNASRAFAGVVGMMDGSHIRIKPMVPKEDVQSFFCRKGFHSVVLHAVVDFLGRFIAATNGVSGCSADQGIFARSNVGRLLKQNPHALLSDGEYLLADSGYSLTNHVLVPYAEAVSPPGSPQARFNYVHASLRNPVERAFGRLKGRWACLQFLPVHHSRAGYYIRSKITRLPSISFASVGCLHFFLSFFLIFLSLQFYLTRCQHASCFIIFASRTVTPPSLITRYSCMCVSFVIFCPGPVSGRAGGGGRPHSRVGARPAQRHLRRSCSVMPVYFT